MKLHFLLAGLVAFGLIASQPDVEAHGGGGWGGGGHGGGSWHGGGYHGGYYGRGRYGRYYYRGRYYYGYGSGYAFYGYPWWGPWWGWGYYGSYYPDYAYDSGGGNYEQSGKGDPPASEFNSTRAVQAALAWRGFYSGRIDGAMGPETRSAIRAFQKQQGLPVTGEIDSELSKALQRRN